MKVVFKPGRFEVYSRDMKDPFVATIFAMVIIDTVRLAYLDRHIAMLQQLATEAR